MTEYGLDFLRGLRPFEAALFADLSLPQSVLNQLERANEDLGKHSLTKEAVERCVWRPACDRRSVSYVSFTSRGTQRKCLCFACRADGRLFVACGTGYGSPLSPGSLWPILQPYGQGNPETLERKFLAWAESPHGVPAIEVTDFIRMTCNDDEAMYLDLIKKAENRNEALLIFSDWLEERSDPRAEKIRDFSKPL